MHRVRVGKGAFRENYAFFALRQVNWDQIYARFRPGLNAASSEADLFKVFSGMLAALRDGHVTLSAGEREIESGGAGEIKQRWLSEGSIADRETALRGYRAAVHSHIMNDIMKGKATQGANGAMALPNVTRIGTPTYGVLSDMLEKHLPNGWSFSLSNEVYLAVDGKLYEGLGIPPMRLTDTRKAKDFHSRLQLDVDAALALASQVAH